MRGFAMSTRRIAQKSSSTPAIPGGALRIGALSKLSGIPSPTLRAWERRYGAFKPHKTGSGQRLYDRSDASRALLIRGLADQGLALHALAQCELNELLRLKSTQAQSADSLVLHEPGQTDAPRNPASLRAVVVGESLALRMLHAKSLEAMQAMGLSFQVAEVMPKPKLLASKRINLVLTEVVSLLEANCEAVLAVKAAMRSKPLLVFYRFGAAHLVALLRHAGILVYREPMDDEALLNALRNLCHELGRSAVTAGSSPKSQTAKRTTIDAEQPAKGIIPLGASARPRRFSITQIRKLAEQSPQLSCECPRHVSEILEQLLAFEDYSERCLSHSVHDIHIHAQLLQVAALARSQFEDALEAVASHEGIML